MRPPKICLIGNSLSFGGADKIHAVLSNYFASQGFEIHNIIFIDAVTYDFSGALLNLGKTYKKGGILEVLNRFRMIFKYLKQHDFDFIIDFRTHRKPLRELILSRMMSRYRYIPTVHSFNTEWYLTPNRFVSKAIFAKAYKIVSVATEIEKKLRTQYGYTNTMTIANPLELLKIDALSDENSDIQFEYILAAGRMEADDHKQFRKLIGAYADSDLPQNGIKLLFLGDGPLRTALEKSAADNNLADMIVFKGFVPNPYPYLKKARFTVLTSKFEGLPNIIAESLASGTPVVSFDCQSGPSDLIRHRENGLLVPDQDWKAFVASIQEMSRNEALRQYCASNARSGVERMDVSQIGQIWKKLLQQ